MLVAAVCLSTFFPERPLEQEFQKGQQLALSVRRDGPSRHLRYPADSAELVSPEAVYKPFRKPIGWWSDGFRKLECEWVLPVEPKMLSVWLGYLKVRDGWQAGEEQGRWEKLSQKATGKNPYIVILSSFPSQPTLGLGEQRPNNDGETEDVTFLFESAVGRTSGQAVKFLCVKGKSRENLEAVPWWQQSPLANELTALHAAPYEAPVIQRGSYARTWWWVWTDDELGDGPVTLKVLSRRKIRTVTFTD